MMGTFRDVSYNIEGIGYEYLYFDLIMKICLRTWDHPSASSSDTYTSGEFVIDLASNPSITITWTADTNPRDCEYISSVQITLEDGITEYFDFTVSHNQETFSLSGSYYVTNDAQTIIDASGAVSGSYKVHYRMTDSVDSSKFEIVTIDLSVI